MGSLWLFGSVDCATAAPQITRLVFAFLLLGFSSLFVPILFFGALCCCLPPALAFLNAYGPALGLRGGDASGAAAGADDAFAWIAALPRHAFAPAPPPGECADLEQPSSPSGAHGEGDAAASGAEAAQPGSPARSQAASDAGSEGEAVGGYLGSRYVAAEDATCVICLGPYVPSGDVVQLPACAHHFHASCLDTWLRVNASCPLCKAAAGPARLEGSGEEAPAAAREAYLRAAVRGGDDLLSVLV
jgi:hypothetical protein